MIASTTSHAAAHREALARRLGAAPSELHWASDAELAAAGRRRSELLAELSGRAGFSCRDSKLVVGELSPGCVRCAEGSWSCLFITGRCNARCFFCPTPQDKVGEPQTAGLRFPRPEDYADYLQRLGFRGASLSGGEPLLDVERTLRFVRVIKRRLGAGLHLWLYSNGTKLTPELAARLGDAGVDEIRFNLAAVGYALDGVRAAASAIATVTVEVPALPDDEARMRSLLPRMAEAGVRHLNLHQLRATPHNLPRLRERDHALIAGPDAMVLGSEETALALLVASLQQGSPLAVHYCSFAYRHRYQAMATRRRAALQFMEPHEALTATGHIRRLSRLGEPAQLAALAVALAAGGHPSSLWRLEADAGLLHVHPSLWREGGGGEAAWSARYEQAVVVPSMSYHQRYRELALNRRRGLVVERSVALRQRPLSANEISFMDTVVGDTSLESAGSQLAGGELAALELIPRGLDFTAAECGVQVTT